MMSLLTNTLGFFILLFSVIRNFFRIPTVCHTKFIRLQGEELENRLVPANVTWNADSGDWKDGGNWQGGERPAATDTAVFSRETATVNVTDNAAIKNLKVISNDCDQTNTNPTIMDLKGNTLAVTEGFWIISQYEVNEDENGPASTTNVTLQSANAGGKITAGGLKIGSNGGGDFTPINKAILSIKKDVTVAVMGSVDVAGDTGGILNVDGGKLTADRLDMGGGDDNSTQTGFISYVNVTSGGEIELARFLMVGAGTGHSVIEIDGTGSKVTSNAEAIIGDLAGGTGKLSISNGGVLKVNSDLMIGHGKDGAVTVKDASSIDVTGTIMFGVGVLVQEATGILDVLSGATVSATNLEIGGNGPFDGIPKKRSVILTGEAGKGVVLNVQNSLTVGYNGLLELNEFSVVSAKDVVVSGAINDLFFKQGELTVKGTDGVTSKFTINNTMTVKDYGTFKHKRGAETKILGSFTIETLGEVKLYNGSNLDLKQGGTNNGTLEVSTNGVFQAREHGAINKGVLKVSSTLGGDTGRAIVQGDFTQNATGHLEIQIAGSAPETGYDLLQVAQLDDENAGGNVVLGGSLDVTFINATYTPTAWTNEGAAGDYYTVVTASDSLSGVFDPTTGLNLPDLSELDLPPASPGHGYEWQVIYDRNDQFDSSLAAQHPAFVSQPWVSNGTRDVVLVIVEKELPTPSTTTLTSSQTPSEPGAAVIFTATVTGNGVTPTGNVTFEEAGNVLGTGVLNTSGVATFTTTDLTSGSHNIIAVYEGDTIYAGSSSNPYTQVVNGTSVATNDTYNMQQGGTLSVNAPGVLANDSDFENTPLAAFLVSQPAHGTAGLNADGSFVYQPAANYSGQDSFTYKVFDGIAYSNTATVTINIEAIPSPTITSVSPTRGIAAGGTTTTIIGTEFIHVMQVKFGNQNALSFTVVDNTHITAVAPSGSSGATVDVSVMTLGGTSANTAADNFQYNNPPSALNDSYSGTMGQTLNISAPGVKSNDSDNENDPMTATLMGNAQHGFVVLNSDGSFSYTPNTNWTGMDSFSYRLNDGYDNSSIAMVSLMIGSPLRVTESDTTRSETVEVVTEAQLQPIVAEAIRRLLPVLGGHTDVVSLQQVSVQIVDLSPGYLGLATAQGIYIDINASGFGWYIDATPNDDSEFTNGELGASAPGVSSHELFAMPNGPATGKIDLRTVVFHEFGHIVGLEHAREGVMKQTLGTGERWLMDEPVSEIMAEPGSPTVNEAPTVHEEPEAFWIQQARLIGDTRTTQIYNTRIVLDEEDLDRIATAVLLDRMSPPAFVSVPSLKPQHDSTNVLSLIRQGGAFVGGAGTDLRIDAECDEPLAEASDDEEPTQDYVVEQFPPIPPIPQ